MNKFDLGTLIKTQRNNLNLSTQELANMSKLSAGYINRIENNKTTNHDVFKLQRLAKNLNINEECLLNCIGCRLDKSIVEDFDTTLTSLLVKNGFDGKSVREILDYVEVIRYKQEMKRGK